MVMSICGCIWTPPDCNSRLDQDRWSQLLTYIRLRNAAGRRLRREPRRVFARFHLKAPMRLAHAMPVHASGSGSDGVTPFRHLLPFAAIAGVGPPFLIRRFASGRLQRQRGLVSCVAREHSPHDPRILVGKCNGRDIGMPPLPHLAEPEASRILLAASPA